MFSPILWAFEKKLFFVVEIISRLFDQEPVGCFLKKTQHGLQDEGRENMENMFNNDV